jgi:two-component system response regulator FixJ
MHISPGLVILVDDDAAVRDSLKFSLELEGLNVLTYESGHVLLADANLPASGCLVVDYYMPVLNGVDLLNRLRHRHVDLPAILITAKATNDVRQRAAAAGFTRVLEKPLEDGSLLDTIHAVLAPSMEA